MPDGITLSRQQEKRPSGLLLSAGFAFLFSPTPSSPRTANSPLLDAGVFLAVATHGSLSLFPFFSFTRDKEEEKKKIHKRFEAN